METGKIIAADDRVKATLGEEVTMLEGGLQPFLLVTSQGTMVAQAQLPEKPYGTKPMVYAHLIATVVSRDGGVSWQRVTRKEGFDEVNIEGGAAQLSDGSIIALDTYVVADPARPDHGIGEVAYSYDDWHTLEEPIPVSFELTNIDVASKKDDGGHDHQAARLHRSVLELPNGDLLTLMYTWFYGDNIPCSYTPSMHKCRTILYRSPDKGRSWRQVGCVVDGTDVGTEGYVEPVLVRLSRGPREGRLICMMRTGRDMMSAYSDDEGLTWSEPRVERFGDIDIHATASWAEQFREIAAQTREERRELRGMYADPDLIELHNGVLVCVFGVRITEKMCWSDPSHPWNGNYVAFSFDQGETWSHVVQVTSGVMTTHYMAVRELEPNVLYIAYDLGAWGKPGRRAVGRRVDLSFAPDL